MNPGKADEEFVQEQLADFFRLSYDKALFEIVEVIAKQAGIVTLNSLSIREFFDQRRRQLTEELLSEFADTFPALASQIKQAWEKLDREQHGEASKS
jgi:hypothetical protein